MAFTPVVPPRDEDKLVELLCGDEWPFHGKRRLTPADVATMELTSDDVASFWVLDDLAAPIGLIRLLDLDDVDDGAPQFDLRIASGHRGRGVGGACTAWIVGHLFQTYPALHRIEANTRGDNTAMRRALSKAGFTHEGTLRESWPGEGRQRFDTAVYGILRTDPAAVDGRRWSGRLNEHQRLPVGLEADAAVQMSRCRVVGFVADLDAGGAGGESIDAGGEDVAGQPPALVVVFRAHRLDEAGRRRRIEPEQAVRGDVATLVVDHQVEVGAIQRRLPQARLRIGVVPMGVDHVVRTMHRLGTTRQPVAGGQRADRRARVGGQPRLDQPALRDDEAMANQDAAQHVVGRIDLESDGTEPVLGGVGQPPLHHPGDQLGRRTGHEHRVEGDPLAEGGEDRGRLRAPRSSNQNNCGTPSVARSRLQHHCRSAASNNPAVG